MNLCDFTSVTIQTANSAFILAIISFTGPENRPVMKMERQSKCIYIYTLHIAAQMAPEEQQLAFHASSRYHNLTQLKLGDSQGVEGAVGLMVSLMMQHSFHCKILLTNAAVCW